MISQLTVFIQNEEGRLADMCKSIADANINMHALFIADTQDFGIVRIFCDTPDVACEHLVDAGYRATLTPVVAVRIPDEKGGLAKLLGFLDSKNVNIEYGYCFSLKDNTAVDILKIDDKTIEDQLTEAGFTIALPGEIYATS